MGNNMTRSPHCWLVLVCLTVSVPVWGLDCHQCYNNPTPGYTITATTQWQLANVDNTALRNFLKELIGEKGGRCTTHDPADIPPMECSDTQTVCYNATYYNVTYSKDRLLLAKGCMTPIPATKDGCWTPPNNQILSATICTCTGDYCNGEPRGTAGRWRLSTVLLSLCGVLLFWESFHKRSEFV